MAKDFRNKQFGRIIRGYNPEEVDEYIAYINDEYRKLERRCADSDRKLALALKKLDEMHQKFMGADNADNELAAAAISE
ncbi:MAG: DivIVA domain-containing protein, partial [Clostridia bacterium]|nr:DivIVA domain-containing protein [Clostridia bacterium]